MDVARAKSWSEVDVAWTFSSSRVSRDASIAESVALLVVAPRSLLLVVAAPRVAQI